MLVSHRWQSTRIFAIALMFGGAVWVLSRALLFPATSADEKVKLQPPDFAKTVSLSQWQLKQAQPLKAKSKGESDGLKYQFVKTNERLEVQSRFERYTDGNISRLLVVYTPIKPATVQPQLQNRIDVGFYYLFEYKNTAYLSACVNYAGQTTVTEPQFVQNKYKYGWSLQRTFLWIIGQEDLFDGRCLWTLMSIPLDSSSNNITLEKAYADLEAAWVDWYNWWQPKLD
jgi:cyanosortase A-associated protein